MMMMMMMLTPCSHHLTAGSECHKLPPLCAGTMLSGRVGGSTLATASALFACLLFDAPRSLLLTRPQGSLVCHCGLQTKARSQETLGSQLCRPHDEPWPHSDPQRCACGGWLPNVRPTSENSSYIRMGASGTRRQLMAFTTKHGSGSIIAGSAATWGVARPTSGGV